MCCLSPAVNQVTIFLLDSWHVLSVPLSFNSEYSLMSWYSVLQPFDLLLMGTCVAGHGMALHLVAPPPPSRPHGLSILPQGSPIQGNSLKPSVTENYLRLREEEPMRVWRSEAEGQMVAVTASGQSWPTCCSVTRPRTATVHPKSPLTA